jgi:hypothetical protein
MTVEMIQLSFMKGSTGYTNSISWRGSSLKTLLINGAIYTE